jgi:serine kinase of HPr protein (carbohydrate metabolism regulator)
MTATSAGERRLVHATAVVVGCMGLALVGRSGAGKTSLAIRLMADARRAGHFAALVSDDQVYLEIAEGRLIASAPAAIRGLIEVRGSAIAGTDSIDCAVLTYALAPIKLDASNRIGEENQRWKPIEGISLPLFAIDREITEPMACLAALLPGFPVHG